MKTPGYALLLFFSSSLLGMGPSHSIVPYTPQSLESSHPLMLTLRESIRTNQDHALAMRPITRIRVNRHSRQQTAARHQQVATRQQSLATNTQPPRQTTPTRSNAQQQPQAPSVRSNPQPQPQPTSTSFATRISTSSPELAGSILVGIAQAFPSDLPETYIQSRPPQPPAPANTSSSLPHSPALQQAQQQNEALARELYHTQCHISQMYQQKLHKLWAQWKHQSLYSSLTQITAFLARNSLDTACEHISHYAQSWYPSPMPSAQSPQTSGGWGFFLKKLIGYGTQHTIHEGAHAITTRIMARSENDIPVPSTITQRFFRALSSFAIADGLLHCYKQLVPASRQSGLLGLSFDWLIRHNINGFAQNYGAQTNETLRHLITNPRDIGNPHTYRNLAKFWKAIPAVQWGENLYKKFRPNFPPRNLDE